MLRILTNRGAEYYGRVAHHDDQFYLAITDIDHTKTKTMSLQTNGIREQLHKTSGLNTITMTELIRVKCVVDEFR